MRKFKPVLTVLSIMVAGLVSFTMVPKKTTPSEKVTAVANAINAAKADGKITTAELNNIASVAKGEKLSLKDKIAIKLFGKKIASKLLAATGSDDGDGKSQLIALILCAFVGDLGIHRFYLGYTWQGIVQLLTLGGCGIWTLIDFVRIITGSLQPKDGSYGKTL
jgi:TM2 domain-containing protein